MPLVQIHLLEGRPVETKRALAQKVTAVVCETLNVPTEAVRVVLSDMKPEDYAMGGVLVCDQKRK